MFGGVTDSGDWCMTELNRFWSHGAAEPCGEVALHGCPLKVLLLRGCAVDVLSGLVLSLGIRAPGGIACLLCGGEAVGDGEYGGGGEGMLAAVRNMSVELNLIPTQRSKATVVVGLNTDLPTH